MEIPSLARSPVAPVLFSLSEPARSTKWNLAVSVSYSSISEFPLETLLSVSASCGITDTQTHSGQGALWPTGGTGVSTAAGTNIVGGADADLTQVDGEDGVGARALDVHLGAGGGARQSAELQALHHLQGERAPSQSSSSSTLSSSSFTLLSIPLNHLLIIIIIIISFEIVRGAKYYTRDH